MCWGIFNLNFSPSLQWVIVHLSLCPVSPPSWYPALESSQCYFSGISLLWAAPRPPTGQKKSATWSYIFKWKWTWTVAGSCLICANSGFFGRGKTPRPEAGASTQQQDEQCSRACRQLRHRPCVWASRTVHRGLGWGCQQLSSAWGKPYCWQRRKKKLSLRCKAMWDV